AAPAPDDADLVFVSSDARLLRFRAAQVRPQGLQASGMSGIALHEGASAIFFGTVGAATLEGALVATVAAGPETLLGAGAGSAKVSLVADFPTKGRATAGVRAQRLLAGEPALALAWVGTAPAHALDAKGRPCALPEAGARRDAAGQPLESAVAFLGGALQL
ncbi:MAG TPA: DNA gyrase C-terminal beta-propeller domain-containing protein, partial [Microbacteriaceae bacterium]|nr:DNA gyrase C-terminal beta-propeller domain-containing protein [Microbacteriaceae bacterium]